MCNNCNGTKKITKTREVKGGSGQIHVITSTSICSCLMNKLVAFDNTKGFNFFDRSNTVKNELMDDCDKNI